VPWDRVQFFWGDERHVPPDDPQSNYRMAREALLSKVSIEPDQVHRIRGENPDADAAAREYEQDLLDFFGCAPDRLPRFDLALLGLGPCGHTASLFPGTGAVREQQRLVVAPWVEKFAGFRITLTPPALNNSAAVIFLVSGAEKAEILRTVLEGAARPDLYPAQIIHPSSGELLWLVDRPAAAALTRIPEARPSAETAHSRVGEERPA
jgi:6-phosphogluconolactonase